MKSLLVLTPRFPYPVVGGDRLRIYQLCRELAAHYRLTLLSLCESPEEMHMALPDDQVFSRVERVRLPRWTSWLNSALALLTRTPLQVAYFRSHEFRRRAAALMPEHDATLAHLIRVGDTIKDLPGAKFLEMTDAISLNYERVRQTRGAAHDFRARIFALEARRLKDYERAIVDRFDHSFLVSEVDRTHLFQDRPDRLARVSVVSNGVDLRHLPFRARNAGDEIVFIGNLNSMQNFDAAMYMAREILPLVMQARPAARLRVIGRIPADKAALLAPLPGVDVTGEVPDVAEAAASGAVGVCPLRLGAGVQNKVLEYMALGLPAVSTTIGLEGFEAEPGRDLLIADTPASFAEAVIGLLRDREHAGRIAVNGRAYVESHHSWSGRLAPLVEIIGARVEPGQTPRGASVAMPD